MPQLEFIPSHYQEVSDAPLNSSDIHLRSSDGEITFDFTFQCLRPGLFRTTFSSKTHPLPPYPSASVPEVGLTQANILSRLTSRTSRTIQVDDINAIIDWQDTPIVTLKWQDSRTPIHSDLKHRSYVVDGNGIAHYTTHDRNALHVGLGEKRAPMDLTARHFQISATDCFGYEVYHTDPMYKHMPLLIKVTPESCVAIFSTSHSRGSWSVGSEIDGLWGHFKVYRQDYGGLEEYLIVGRTLQDVLRNYAELVGFPILAPRWAYGYLSGGYKYTMGDDPPAYKQILEFIDKLEEHDIPCSAHQMSSGYSIAEVEPKVRNVFTWNRHRFPDPEAWVDKCHSRGIRLLTNIKPFVLTSHPDYQYLASVGGLFIDPVQKKTAVMRLWSAGGGDSGDGSHIDFTCPEAFEWWCRGVETLKLQGIDAMWNDNNEYTLPNDRWQMSLKNFSAQENSAVKNHVGLWGRAMHTELMGKASYKGLLRVEPNARPFVLTRSATVGTLRYAASSWSGDNVTSWEGMKGANCLSLNAGMSLMHCYGHDIGGFEGPQPSPELLLRWIQSGIYAPRFAINCFKTSPKDNAIGEVIEPWMYSEITPLIRKAIKRRYEIMPYIYSLALEGHLTAVPPQRWIGMGYESDPEVWTKFLKNGEEQYWFGDALLIGGVYEPDKTAAKMYLPRKASDEFDYGYVNLNSPFQYLASGQWVSIESKWREHIPVLAKIGSVVPVGKSMQTRIPGEANPACNSLPEDNYRGLEIFPPKGTSHGKTFVTTFFDDDGISLQSNISKYTVAYSSTAETVMVGFQPHQINVFEPPWKEVVFILPHGDERHVVSDDGRPVKRIVVPDDDRARFVYQVEHPNKKSIPVM